MSEGKRRTAGRPAGSGKSVSGHSQSLVRGLNLLERLSASPGGLALSELAEQADLAPSTTHRLLQALQSQGFVIQDAELGVWKIDVKTFRIGNSFLEARDFVGTSRPFLRRLTAQTGETANLGIRDNGTAVFLAQSESPQMMRMITRLGSRAPLHASGVGKALMAWLPDDELERVLSEQGLTQVTENTLATPQALREGLAEIRRQGFAGDREEHAIGLHCVAACIHDQHGIPLAAISVSGPVARIPEARLLELGALVRDTAAEITAHLGGRIPEPW
ncbi:IclR family transcriptional regulator domain-containing protein [Halomonas urumqiensis]|uniref:HTH-type transcriptional repressor AllR n=1 Tax=Halomonas urumqiensis TaxID=1684789 RepID=A0A2N7UK72_9GAMM|nr:IclR family transcriptional regulator C-terminal domain-containing protein [Halomonas urumqiensis]PMR80837.1 IclR family transcriptional regulator [Halomonas urumqiensis]PTB02794.1 IclR family transcriptional regulator [Halomonas urumqiensis]GHE21299.1 IclR family transcriptional regulator [Halomonas urumqiensis]